MENWKYDTKSYNKSPVNKRIINFQKILNFQIIHNFKPNEYKLPNELVLPPINVKKLRFSSPKKKCSNLIWPVKDFLMKNWTQNAYELNKFSYLDKKLLLLI